MDSPSFTGRPGGEVFAPDGRPLDPKLDLINHSPDGFAWGYSGSGPSQLAFAMVFEATAGNEELTRRTYQEFKNRVISRLNRDEGFAIPEEFVLKVVNEIEAERSRRRDHMSWGPGDVEFL